MDSAIVLALCEGRIGLAISGVFGAGKTRSAAVLLFAFHLFSNNVMADQRQNVDDRQSLERARHGLKKKTQLLPCWLDYWSSTRYN